MSNEKNNLTPLMRQYYEIKNKYPDTLLLFQVGDFYELFFEDAQKAASFLGIALTQRGTTSQGDPIPLCGVPVHVLDTYLTKLVRGGFKVAICDQLEVSKAGKVIERGVTQVLTPGTLTDCKLLDAKSASYLCTFFPTQDQWALLFAEVLTGQVFITKISDKSHMILEAELSRFTPDEIIVPNSKCGNAFVIALQKQGYIVTCENFNPSMNTIEQEASHWFSQQFGQPAQHYGDAVYASIMLFYSYLKRNNERALGQLKQLSVYNCEDFLMLDANTQRNLDLVKNSHDGSTQHTLFEVLDQAVTAMGSRTIKKWLMRPLIKKEALEQRLDVVQKLVQDFTLREQLRSCMKAVGDLERIVGRIGLRRAQLHDYQALGRALEVIPEINKALEGLEADSPLGIIRARLGDFSALYNLLLNALNDDPTREWCIKTGFNGELDRLRSLLEQGTQTIINLERKEQLATGINSLKIKYNGAHGYGIEVTKTNIHLVPAHYMRVQTLVNRERYTTQELKDLEYDLLRARNDINEVEKEAFEKVKAHVESYLNGLKKLAQGLSYLDALAALADVAYTYGYTRPVFSDKREIAIFDGCHPMVQARLQSKFIPNNTTLSDEQALWIITGPNMGGKSTYLRQVALIAIMAQIGSFVPAAQARLSIVDRIFTRIGAADNVAEGKSTFLVEMEETALICTQATGSSLVILDEVGRGTSTYDGLAIAQAVVEHIYSQVQAFCLFATHYHELTHLTQKYKGIVSYYAASTKTPQGIVLLHKIMAGVADGSFGLEVAKLAQLPEGLITRAHEILERLTRVELQAMEVLTKKDTVSQNDNVELRLKCAELETRKKELEMYVVQREQAIARESKLAQELASIDCEQLTAKQALDILWRLKEQAS